MEKQLNRCEICNSLIQHLKILYMELGNSESHSNMKQATLMELKCYYWLIKAYLNEMICECDCDYSNGLSNILADLSNIFKKEDIVLDEKAQKCDVCKILPCEFFSLLNNACIIKDQNEMDSMIEELQYQVTLAFLYEEFIGKCTECDEFIEYAICLKFACEFIESSNMQKLQQDVYFWKKARNNDEIWSCADALMMDEVIEYTEVDLTNHTTIYLDFNVYERYEDEEAVQEFFEKLNKHENIDIIYSGTHLEEVLRMNDKDSEQKRIESIQTLTDGKIAVVGSDKKSMICIQDINKRFRHVKKYLKMNAAAEERECIEAEAREHLCLHEMNEKKDKAIGSSSLKGILSNINKNGKKVNEQLPDEDELNKILRYVGIGDRSIRAYMDSLEGKKKDFNEVRTTIVSIAELLNILGLHSDKIKKKTNFGAVYPIYHKDSYKTIRSGYYDNDHLAFATKCTYFVTTDVTLYKKAKEIFDFLGVDTVPMLLKNFMKYQFDMV